MPHWSQSSLVFYCGAGHEVTIEEVVRAESTSLNSGLESVLVNWQARLHNMRQTVTEAKARGHHDIVDVFQRHIGNMEARIRILRDAIRKAGGQP